MTGVRRSTQVLVLPVIGKRWLYAVEDTVQQLTAVESWREGKTLIKKAQLGKIQLLQLAHGRVLAQWESLQKAPKGSLKSWLYRLALKALEQEDVADTFLKKLPSETDHYQFIFPSDLNKKLVRRRTRLFLQQQEYHQRCRQILWCSLIVPMVPLLVLPAPNIPMYYAAYKVYSHTAALKGCRQLLRTLQNNETNETTISSADHSASATHSTAISESSDLPASAPAFAAAGIVTPSATASNDQSTYDGASTETTNSRSSPVATFAMHPDQDVAEMLSSSKRNNEAPTEQLAKLIGESLGFPSLPGLLKRILPAT